MKIVKSSASAIEANYLGSVIDVINGKLSADKVKIELNAADYLYGFELASPSTPQALGEAVIVNDYCFATSTDKSSTKYLQTINGNKFISTGVFLIPKSTQPTHTINTTFTQAIPLNQLYKQIYQEIQHPFAFAGFFEFATLNTTMVIKSPIYGQNIFENKDLYYPKTPHLQQNSNAFLVGVAANFNQYLNQELLKQLEIVLYNNPFDNEQALTTHAHCLTLNKNIKHATDIIPSSVQQTKHVLNDRTLIKSIHSGEIFTLQNLTKIK